MLATPCQYIELEKVKYPLVNHFYKRVYKKGTAGKNERVFILRNEKQIICSAKLKLLEDNALLTGVACDPQFQHQGYASLLVKKILANNKETIYCFPYAHLERFYLQLGFVLLPVEDAPEAIKNRFNRYQENRDLLLMIYLNNANKCS